MGEVLSQEEVDSLLSGLTTGKVETKEEEEEGKESSVEGDGEIKKYDFASQERVVRGRMPTLEVINERIAKEMRDSISSILKINIDIVISSTETLKFADFGRSLPVPTSLHIFRLEPLRGFALIIFESQLVFKIIDTFCGGTGTGDAKIEGRDFTVIETTMIKKVVSSCLKDIEKAWAPVEAISTAYVRAEVNPQFATIALPTDLIIVTKFELEMEQNSGVISICLPYSMIEPIRNKLTAGFQSDALEIDKAWQERMMSIIIDSKINFAVMLGSTEITGERLIHLKPGDVVQLDQDADKFLTGLVESVPKFFGFAGIQRGFQSLRIDQRIYIK